MGGVAAGFPKPKFAPSQTHLGEAAMKRNSKASKAALILAIAAIAGGAAL